MKNNSYKTYNLYLKFLFLSISLFSLFWMTLMYLLWPGLSNIDIHMAYGIELILFLIPATYIILWLLMLLLIYQDIGLPAVLLRICNRGLYSLFPFMVLCGKLIGISRDELSQSLIALINMLVRRNLYRIKPEKVLLLTPHCLQNSNCVHKVTTDVHNCKKCGKCPIGDLLQIAEKYQCHFAVVTGGTLARLTIKKLRPEAIIAIACERDLVSGMQDVFPIHVIGILNERPCGPCCNTTVNIVEVENVLKEIYGKSRK